MTPPLLEVEDLSVRFDTDEGTVHAVDRVSLTLAPREVLGIVGESGCGKSVTALSILGLLPQTATVTGSARFEGRAPGAPRRAPARCAASGSRSSSRSR